MGHRRLITIAVLLLARMGFAADAPSSAVTPSISGAPSPADTPAAADELFGPLIAPMHIIDAPPGLDSFTAASNPTIHVLPDGKALWLGVEPRANVWAIIVFFWPELTIALLLLLLLWPTWRVGRVMRRPQARGQPHCRRCNYQLTGNTSATCPECGCELTPRNQVTGRSRRRRALPSLIIATVLLAGLTTLAVLWEKPSAFGWWTVEPVLPREGSVNEWFHWYSGPAYRWCQRNRVKLYGWLPGDGLNAAQLWEVDLREPRRMTLVHEYALENWISGGVPDSPRFWIRDGAVGVADNRGWRLYDPVERKVRLIMPWQESLISNGELTVGRFTEDRRLLFDNRTLESFVAWDTASWKPHVFPVPAPQGDRLVVTKASLIAGERGAVIEYHLAGKERDKRIIGWWPETGELLPMPPEWMDYGFDRYAFANERRYLVGEQETWTGNGQLAWDLKTGKALAEIDDVGLGKVNGERIDLVLMAVSKRGSKAYLIGRNTKERWHEWNLETGEVTALPHAPAGRDADDLTWVRSITEVLDPPVMAFEVVNGLNGWGIEVRERVRDNKVDAIPTPTPVGSFFQWINYDTFDTGITLSPDKRFVVVCGDKRFLSATAGSTVVVFDRQKRQWIGRFGDATHCSNFLDARWSDDGRLLIVIGEGETNSRVLVFDMERFR